jgi:UDP-N-acetylglucosamine--N-acetylmuramyl-(pentapeptide) pyrophosphoryl-undecaprenol N-acetylglucosamine transferase
MRVVLSGGGTGGHVYPALAVLEALRQPPHHLGNGQVLYVGGAGRAEAQLVPAAGAPFRSIATGAVLGRGPLALLASAFRNLLGLLQAAAILRRFRPGVVFATGGYISVPVVLAAWLLRIPTVVCLPDAAPGLAVRFLARFASRITVSVPAAAAAFPPGKAVAAGYPVRAEFAALDRAAVRQRLGVGPDGRLVLVMGGSLGASAINRAIGDNLEGLLALCHLLHVSGPADAGWLNERRAALPEALQSRYTVLDYLHQGVADAMAAADLAVCRSGASVLGELPCAGLPTILVPYPLAGGHQRANARLLMNEGAALLLEEADLDELPSMVATLLNAPDRLDAMRARLTAIAKPGAAAAIAALLADLAAHSAPQPNAVAKAL